MPKEKEQWEKKFDKKFKTMTTINGDIVIDYLIFKEKTTDVCVGSDIKQFIQTLLSERDELLREIHQQILLRMDKLEENQGETTMEEWRNWKHVRNNITNVFNALIKSKGVDL